MLGIMLGVLLFAGGAFAADANMLQPASDIVYNENVDINGSLDTDSLRVGTPGLGGVTFFNGTVLNEGTDPFTIGDDMRVDGEIYRIQKGDDPIKISDNVIPTVSGYNDLGSTDNRWDNFYSNSGNFKSKLQFGGEFLFRNSSNELIGYMYQLPDTKDLRLEASEGGLGLHADSGIVYLSNQSYLRLGKTGTPTCNSKTEGVIEYRAGSGFYGCDGSSWRKLDN